MTDRGTVEYPFERPKKAKPMKLPKTAAATTLALALAGPAAAREVLGVFGDWTAFKDDDGKACYMASAPKSAKGNYTKRGDPYLMVLKRIGGRGPDEVSVEAGYSYKADSQVTLTVVIGQSDKTFKMFTKGETAWAWSGEDDREISKAIRAGSKATVVGRSKRGTKTTDIYGLDGSTAAYEAITDACE